MPYKNRPKYDPLLLFLVFFIPLVVYSGNLAAGFVYDDNVQILANPWIRDAANLPEIFRSSSMSFLKDKPANTYRPLVYVVYMAEYHLFGLRPLGWHLVNMLLHSLNAVMVFITVSYLLASREEVSSSVPRGWYRPGGAAFLAGLLFALHPVNSEVVSWVAAVPELVYTLLVLAAFHLYVRAGEPEARGRARYALSLLCFFLALLAKETAMALIIIIPVYEFTGRGWGFVKRWRVMSVYLVPALLYMTVRTVVLKGIVQVKGMELSLYETVLNIFPLVARYLGKLIMPLGLSAIYSYEPVRSAAAPMAITGLVAAAVFTSALIVSRREWPASFFLIWILMPLLPVLYVPAVSVGGFADRYLYLSSAGYAGLLGVVYLKAGAVLRAREGGGGGGLGGKRAVPAVIAAAVLLLFAAGSVKRSIVWRNDLNLWSDAVKKTPSSPNAHYNLGWALHRQGSLEGALREYTEALRLNPAKGEAHYNAALIYDKKGDYRSALRHYRESVRLNHSVPGALYNMAIIYQKAGDVKKAIVLYRELLRLSPLNENAHYNLALAYQSAGDYRSALRHYREVVRLNPASADAHYNMGLIYRRQGFPERAASEFMAALEADPGYTLAREELKRVLTPEGGGG